MPFEKARTSLFQIEDRLRRLFGLAGPIGAELNAGQVTPVILVNDARDPGLCAARGRRWAFASNEAAGLGNGVVLQFGADVIVDRIVMNLTTAGTTILQVAVLEPGATPGVIPVTAAGVWTELRTVATDAPPILYQSGAVTAGQFTLTRLVHQISVTNGSLALSRECAIHVPAGGFIQTRVSNAAGTFQSVGLEGRIF